MEIEHLLQWSKCSIFNNISKYIFKGVKRHHHGVKGFKASAIDFIDTLPQNEVLLPFNLLDCIYLDLCCNIQNFKIPASLLECNLGAILEFRAFLEKVYLSKSMSYMVLKANALGDLSICWAFDRQDYCGNSLMYCLWPCFLGITSTGRLSSWFLWFYVQQQPKAQPAVVLVLN